ncbi:kyphoscoliosis peptidase [Protopterus annectens]|uniref:kyphoscoliosis peptidase n=1 Tax=Protopterus annectens TaxID=7888 RepID=UPI001CFC4699|nr:kyphoscoliosis peptidase [Protopterus annectens]
MGEHRNKTENACDNQGDQRNKNENVYDNQGELRSKSENVHNNKGEQRNKGEYAYDNKGEQKNKIENAYNNQGFTEWDIYPDNQYGHQADPSCLKSQAIDLTKFEKLDAYASKVIATGSMESLVKALLKEAHSDLEKVRAIWIWICHHIEYDVKGYHNKRLRRCAPDDVLHTRQAVCSGYAGLFKQMCSFAGVRCEEISGYSKGYSYKIGTTFKDTNHAWNAVHLDGKWHLLDSTWGAGNVQENCTVFSFNYKEFYFLTHPALFIEDHYPVNTVWQLLNPVVPLKQFESRIMKSGSFFEMGLVSLHPETAEIKTVNGKTTITIEGTCHTLFLFDLNGKCEHGLMTLTNNGMVLEVYPRTKGEHRLVLFAKAFDAKSENFEYICEYRLTCNSINANFYIPKDLMNPVGPSWLTENKGLCGASQPNPIIYTNDGRCSVNFCLEKNLEFTATLQSDDVIINKNILNRHIFQRKWNNIIEFNIQLPQAGLFVLSIFGKEKSASGNSYDYICNYLISCTNPEVKWSMFPLNYESWSIDYELVEPLAGILPANRDIHFKLKVPDVSTVIVNGKDEYPLTMTTDGYWEGIYNTVGCKQLNVIIPDKYRDNYYTFILSYQVEKE